MAVQVFIPVNEGGRGKFHYGVIDASDETAWFSHTRCPRAEIEGVGKTLGHYFMAVVVEEEGMGGMREEEEPLLMKLEPIPAIVPESPADNHRLP